MKIVTSLVLFFLLMYGTSFAGFNGPSKSSMSVGNVQQAISSGETTTYVLEGKIIKHLERNRYEFFDNTGTMVIDIPPHVFGQVEVTPENTVRITGEIGGKKRPEHMDVHLRVRYIEKIS